MSMLPLVPFRQPPLGYTEDRDASVWNVGFVYRWSDVYDAWMESGRCTVKPDQTCREAFEDWAGHPMGLYYSIFFNEAM